MTVEGAVEGAVEEAVEESLRRPFEEAVRGGRWGVVEEAV